MYLSGKRFGARKFAANFDHKAMTEATAYSNAISQKENDDALDDMRKSGKTKIYTLTADDKKAWIAALRPVHAHPP